MNYICIVFNQNIDIMDSKLDLKIDVLPTRKRTHKVHRNSESQKRFGHRTATTSKNKNKDVPINEILKILLIGSEYDIIDNILVVNMYYKTYNVSWLKDIIGNYSC